MVERSCKKWPRSIGARRAAAVGRKSRGDFWRICPFSVGGSRRSFVTVRRHEEIEMIRSLKQHFPLAALVATGLPLAAGDGALFIVACAALICALPLVYGGDVEQVINATVARLDDE
jgi:hypothetical protein